MLVCIHDVSFKAHAFFCIVLLFILYFLGGCGAERPPIIHSTDTLDAVDQECRSVFPMFIPQSIALRADGTTSKLYRQTRLDGVKVYLNVRYDENYRVLSYSYIAF